MLGRPIRTQVYERRIAHFLVAVQLFFRDASILTSSESSELLAADPNLHSSLVPHIKIYFRRPRITLVKFRAASRTAAFLTGSHKVSAINTRDDAQGEIVSSGVPAAEARGEEHG
jgi:hypothetical protein